MRYDSTVKAMEDGALEIVGTSFRQETLKGIMLDAGYRLGDARATLYASAALVAEDDNPHDENAVGVYVDEALVAYLSRRSAIEHRLGGAGPHEPVEVVLFWSPRHRNVSVWPA